MSCKFRPKYYAWIQCPVKGKSALNGSDIPDFNRPCQISDCSFKQRVYSPHDCPCCTKRRGKHYFIMNERCGGNDIRNLTDINYYVFIISYSRPCNPLNDDMSIRPKYLITQVL